MFKLWFAGSQPISCDKQRAKTGNLHLSEKSTCGRKDLHGSYASFPLHGIRGEIGSKIARGRGVSENPSVVEREETSLKFVDLI